MRQTERMQRPFRQVDVFGSSPYRGNPVAVVFDAEGLSDEELKRFSVWTNLSECTFVVPPTQPGADYAVRIFSLDQELPFAGHPTLGTACAWLDSGGLPQEPGLIMQECPAGLVPIRQGGDILAFSSPPRTRSGPVDPQYLADVVDILGIEPDEVVAAEWLDNGPGWVGVLLGDSDRLLGLRPDAAEHPGHWDIGVIAPAPASAPHAFELRAFFIDREGMLREDPVTGSLNASAAEWLLATRRATAPYLARQGTAIGRDGEVHVVSADGRIWVGGRTAVAISGTIEI